MPSPPVTPADPQEIRAHLDRVLTGAAFRGSKRSQEFLRFVVERTLKGDGANLKNALSASNSSVAPPPMTPMTMPSSA